MFKHRFIKVALTSIFAMMMCFGCAEKEFQTCTIPSVIVLEDPVLNTSTMEITVSAVYNGDDDEVGLALASYGGNRITFGIDNDVDFKAESISESRGKYSFDIMAFGNRLCRAELSVTGYHNIYNALAASAVAWLCGIEGERIASALSDFCGAARRMEYKGTVGGAAVYDDYGHHPTEVKATLSGAHGLCSDGGRLFCLFQPHTYSRTKALFDDFADGLSFADRVIVANIYAARETDTLGVSSGLLAERIGKKATWAESLQGAADIIHSELREGDTLVVMGAGDIYKIFDLLNFDGDEK